MWFLAKHTFVKFAVDFRPEMAFFLQMAFFQINLLSSQSIESFGSPLMAESFQACFFFLLHSYENQSKLYGRMDGSKF